MLRKQLSCWLWLAVGAQEVSLRVVQDLRPRPYLTGREINVRSG